MEDIFIKDLSNQSIGNEIERFASLGDMEIPDHGPEVVKLFRDKFWRYPAHIMRKAFDQWLTGRFPDIFRVKKITIKFLSDILRQYILDNAHRIKFYEPPALPSPPEDPKVKEERFKNCFIQCRDHFFANYEGKRNKQISRWLMQIVWDGMVERGIVKDDQYSIDEISPLIDFLEQDNIRNRQMLVKGLEANKRKYYEKLFQELEDRNNTHVKEIQSAKLALYFIKHKKNENQ